MPEEARKKKAKKPRKLSIKQRISKDLRVKKKELRAKLRQVERDLRSLTGRKKKPTA